MSWSNEEIIASLSFPGEWLPEEALTMAIESYDEIKGELHAALKLSPDEIRNFDDAAEEGYMLQFFAMYLAAAVRDREAFPLIRDFFTTFGEAGCETLGDMITEHLDQILASVCDDAEALKAAANLPDMGEWVRSAYFGALGILAHDGRLERERLVAMFGQWLQGDTLSQTDCTSMAFVCANLSLLELEEILLNALACGRIDSDMIGREEFIEMMRSEQMPEYMHDHFAVVDDIIGLLSLWYDHHEPEPMAPLFPLEEIIAFKPLLDTCDDELSLNFLHGFIFATVLTPEPVSANEWIPCLFGGEMPKFDSVEAANKQIGGLMQCYNRLNLARLETELHCPIGTGNKTAQSGVDAAIEWCKGFMHAVAMRTGYWSPEDNAEHGGEEVNTAIAIVMALASDKVADELLKDFGKEQNGEERTRLLTSCLFSLSEAIDTLILHTQAQETHRLAHLKSARSNKVGRNAPCPCGSGKKFKRCCGAPDRKVH